MNIMEFAEKLRTKVQKLLEGKTRVEVIPIEETSQAKMQFITETPGFELDLYMEGYYKMYRRHGDMNGLAGLVAGIYNRYRSEMEWMNSEKLTEWESVKDHIEYMLVNREWNRTVLQYVPYVEYLDMAVVFGIRAGNYRNRRTFQPVYNELFRQWNIGIDELMRTAEKNTAKYQPYTFRSLKDILKGLQKMGGYVEEDGEELRDMYVLTNMLEQFGAAAILYPGALKKISDRLGGDLYLIPSSIHEMLILSAEDEEDVSALYDGMAAVDQNMIRQAERLSDKIYYYHADTGEVTVAEK